MGVQACSHKAKAADEERELQLGAYQTNFVTYGYESVQIVDAGRVHLKIMKS